MRPSAANRERRFFGVAHKVRYSDEPHLISYVTAVRHAYSGAGRCEYELLTVLQISFGVNVWEAGLAAAAPSRQICGVHGLA
jgi:hypothetical protein